MVEYWVTLGKDNKNYYFKRSRGHTKRISEYEYNKHGEEPVSRYSVTIKDGNYNYFKTVNGRKLRVSHSDFTKNTNEYLPNLRYVMRKIHNDYVMWNNDLPQVYSLYHTPRTGVLAVLPVVKRSPVYHVPDKKDKNVDSKLNDCLSIRQNIKESEKLYTCHHTEFLKQNNIRQLLSGTVFPTLLDSWVCLELECGYFKVNLPQKKPLSKFNLREMKPERKLLLYKKMNELVSKAHEKGVVLYINHRRGKDEGISEVDWSNIIPIGDFETGEYELKLSTVPIEARIFKIRTQDDFKDFMENAAWDHLTWFHSEDAAF